MPKCISILLLIFSLMLMVFLPAQAQDENLLSEARVPIRQDNVQTLAQLANFDMPGGMTAMSSGTELTFSPAESGQHLLLGQRLNSLGGKSIVRLWDVSTGEERLAVEDDRLWTPLIFSPEGIALFELAMNSSGDIKIGVWDISNGQKYHWRMLFPQIGCARPSVYYLFFDAKNVLLAFGYDSCDNKGILWNARTGRLVSEWEASGGYFQAINDAEDMVIHSDENHLALIRMMDGNKIIELPIRAYNAAVSPDESMLAVVDSDYRITLWDIASGEQVGQAEGYEAGVHDVIYSPDGSLLVAATDEAILFWDAETLELLHRLDVLMVSEVAFSPDGSLLVLGGLTNEVTLWGVLG